MTTVHQHTSSACTIRAVAVALATLVLVSACGPGGDPVEPCVVSAVGVSPATAAVALGATTQLTATPTAQNCTPLPTTSWTSGTPSVAIVSATGVVTALTLGSSTITATVGSAFGSSLVTVIPVPVASVQVSPASASVIVGQTTTLSAVPRDAANNVLAGRTVTWTTSSPTVATVSNLGVVSGLAAGPVTISATVEGVVGSAAITVIVPPVATVTVTTPSAIVNVAATLQATAVLRDAGGATLTGRSVTWGSSNSGVATVSGSGLITAVAAGPVTITASSEGQSGAVSVTVQLAVASVTITPGSALLVIGGSVTPTVVLRASNLAVLTGRQVTWNSGTPARATVNPTTGLIAALAPGAVTITATAEGVVGSILVNVTPALESDRFANAWINDAASVIGAPYTPNTLYSHNATGGTISAVRTGTGAYTVTFGKLAKAGAGPLRENVFVTAFGSAGEHCYVSNWSDANATDLAVLVGCVSITGAPVNSRFDIAVIGSSTLVGKYGFMWNQDDAATAAGYPSYSFSSDGGDIISTRVSSGRYNAGLGLTNAVKTTALVSTYGGGGVCAIDGWAQSIGLVTVLCTANNSTTSRDSRFSVALLVAGRANKRWGFAWNDVPSAALNTPYSPSSAYQNQSNGSAVSITRGAVGEYVVTFAGLGGTIFGGTMLVTPYGNGVNPPGPCQITGWGGTPDLVVGVRCWSFATGALVDQRFSILAIE